MLSRLKWGFFTKLGCTYLTVIVLACWSMVGDMPTPSYAPYEVYDGVTMFLFMLVPFGLGVMVGVEQVKGE